MDESTKFYIETNSDDFEHHIFLISMEIEWDVIESRLDDISDWYSMGMSSSDAIRNLKRQKNE